MMAMPGGIPGGAQGGMPPAMPGMAAGGAGRSEARDRVILLRLKNPYGGKTLELLGYMCRAAARLDPEFAIVGGDLAYVNNEPKAHERWFDFFRIWGESMLTSDGRIIQVPEDILVDKYGRPVGPAPKK